MTSTQTSLFQSGDAKFSPCGQYRYWLERDLGYQRPLVICGLNPSIATATKNDPTVRKEMGFAQRWGCGRLVKVNAYAFIATDPNVMKKARKAGRDVVGPDNDAAIVRAAEVARECDGIFLVAWGANIEPQRQAEIDLLIRMIVTPMCLGQNGDGSPVHPLYIPYDREKRPWAAP